MASGAWTGDEADRRVYARSVLRAYAKRLLTLAVAVWIFSGAFVLIEPSPYELMFLAVLPLMMLAGINLHAGTLTLLALVVGFIPFALIGVWQAQGMTLLQTLVYTSVTIFLMITSYATANYVAQDTERRMRLILGAYLAAAVASALIGTLAYLGVIPGADFFTLYGRAKAFFKDPNVLAPFLVLPAMWALRQLLLARGGHLALHGLAYLIVFIGVFVTFSRGGWGHFALSSAMVFALTFTLEAQARDQVRMIVLCLAGFLVIALVLAFLLNIDSVAALFAERFSLSQSYDTGSSGRFGRMGYALELAIANPWGLGPLDFGTFYALEQPHNTYLNVIHAYGWGGGAAFIAMIVIALARGVVALSRPSRLRPFLIVVMSTYVPLVLLAGIIDVDHWRHFFLLVGLVWGLSVATSKPHNRYGYRRPER